MSAIAYTQLKKRFNEVIEAALESGETIHVTRADGRDFAIVPDETAYLTKTQNNKDRLKAAKAEIDAKIAAKA